MALANYTDLQTSVGSWLHRSDLTALIPDFISLAESRLNRRLALLSMETDADLTATPGSRYIALPDDFNKPVALWIDSIDPREKLTYVLPSSLPVSESSAQPQYWAVDNSNIAFERPAGGAYSFTLRYIKKFALSNSATTNALLTSYPDAYLFASLLEATPYMRDDSRIPVWQDRLDRAIAEISDSENATRAKASLRTELAGANGLSFDINRGY